MKNKIIKTEKYAEMFGNRLCDIIPKTIERKMDNKNVLNAHLKLFVFIIYFILFG